MKSRLVFSAFILSFLLSPMGSVRAQEKNLGLFRVTYYWVAQEESHPGLPRVPLLDPEGRVLARVSDDFARAVTMEGTGILKDGRVINLHSKCPEAEYGWCFFLVDSTEAPFGYGTSKPLRPFRTIAVKDGIPEGAVVYIPDFEGIPMPTDQGGVEYHDGCFVVEDTGWSLGDRHLDVFVLAEPFYKAIQAELGNRDRVTVILGAPNCPDSAAHLYDPTAWAKDIKDLD